MNILIIGGCGFIGKQLTKSLLEDSNSVTVLDDLSNSLLPSFDNYYEYTFIYGKVEEINSLLDITEFDVVYHLASESRPLMFTKSVEKIISTNITGLLEIVKCIHPRTKLIYASTSEVYGNNEHLLNEDNASIVNTKHQRNVYSISKMLAENILQNNKQLNWGIVRFFNVYGPENRNDDTKIIPMIIKALKNDEHFKICGSGQQVRSFTYIDDAVDALKLIMKDGRHHETYNIGSGDYFSIEQVIRMVKQFTPINTIRIPARRGEPFVRKVDSKKIKTLLKWQPNVKLPVGLRRILLYHEIIKK